MRIHRGSITTVAVLLCAAVFTTAVALAHVEVDKTSPRRGGTAKTSLSSVTITFDGPLRRGTLRVYGPSDQLVSIGKGGRDPRKISRLITELESGKKAGRYRAKYTLVAADGHKQRGSFRFRLRR